MSYVLDLSCQGTKCIFTFTDVINFHVLKIVIFVGVNLSIHVRLFSLEPSFVVCTFFFSIVQRHNCVGYHTWKVCLLVIVSVRKTQSSQATLHRANATYCAVHNKITFFVEYTHDLDLFGIFI